MKKTVIALLAFLMLASCTVSDGGTGTVTVTVPGRSLTRGVSDVVMESDHYDVSIHNDDRGFSYETKRVTLPDTRAEFRVASGTNTVSVIAYNADGIRIGSGHETIDVKAGRDNSVSVRVTEDEGKADLTIKVNTSLSGVTLHAELFHGESDHVTPTLTVALDRTGNTWQKTVSLDRGYWMIMIKDQHGEIWGKVGSVRLVADNPSVWTMNVKNDRFDVDITIDNRVIPTPVISISGNRAEYRDDEAYSVSASVSGMTGEPAWSWFLDGKLIPGEGSSVLSGSFDPASMTEGVHSLSALAESGSTAWSESVNFSYVKGTVAPEPPRTGITLDRYELTAGSSSPEELSFTVTKDSSSSSYGITSVPSWIVLNGPSTDGLKDTWTLSLSGNSSTSERSAVILVGEKSLTVRQPGAPAPDPGIRGIAGIAPNSLLFPLSGSAKQNIVVTRKTEDTEYRVVPGADWVTAKKTGTSGLEDTWEISVKDNALSSDRKTDLRVGDWTVPVMHGGKYDGSLSPERVVIDAVTPYFDDVHFWLDTTYSISAHVDPLGASQDLTYRIESLGKGHGSGSTDRFVDDRTVPAFIEFDPVNGTVRPYELGDSYWSRNYRVTVSSKADPSISAYVDFTIARDGNAGIKNVSQKDVVLSDHTKTTVPVEIEKRTAGSTRITWDGDPWLAASRTGVSPNGLTETWEIAVGPNRTSAGRTGKIVFTANGTKHTVSVTQPGDPSPERHTEWVHGVVPPEDWEYVRDPNVSPEYFEIYERKDIDQGWYLATKSQLSGQERYNQDQNMCWAYAATNMIHWWAEHDRAYIDAFRSVHPDADIDIVYDKTAPWVKDKSTVMPWFIARHGNSGGHPNVALLDMLVRPRHTGAGQFENGVWADLPNRTYPGWFNEVFRGHEHEIVEISSIPTKKDFHDAVERALLLDKAIGLNIHYYNVRIEGGYHAINIWGITYDENGEIVEVVIGDNNLNSSRVDEPNLAYLTNYKVTYAEGRPINDKTESEVEFWNTGVTEESEKKAMGCINQLVFLDLGTELWDDWMAENGLTL